MRRAIVYDKAGKHIFRCRWISILQDLWRTCRGIFPPDSILGMKKHFRQCACIRQKREVKEKAYKEREHCELVEKNRKICFEEPRMYDWNFELAEKTTTIEKAKEYTANWNNMKKNHIGFLLWGPIGTGKSYIAGCIANALLNQEITVKMTNFNTIIDDMFPLEDKTEYINALARYELLILDDLGTERNSEYALGIVFSVIDRRYRSGRPLIVTTNLPIKQLKEETNIEKKRIYDRILEMCVPLYVGGSNYRSDIAHEKNGKNENLFRYCRIKSD